MQPSDMQAFFIRLRNNRLFELFVIGIIIFSALVVGAKTYDIPPLALKIIEILDWGITLFFLIEISIRFFAEHPRRNFFKSGWNLFDATVVIISLIPVNNSDLALVGRLVRIFRVMRMVSVIPELRMLLNSLLIALPRLGYVLLLMFIIFYIYAAGGSIFFANINPDLWGNITLSLLTLFRIMTFEDWTDIMYETMEFHPISWIYYVSFIFLTAFAFLNMIIGTILEVMDEERRRYLSDNHIEPSLSDIEKQLQELKALIEAERR